MTFEDILCKIIQEKIENELNNGSSIIPIITNNVQYLPLENSTNEVCGILRGGNASALEISGINLRTSIATITFYLDINNLSEFLSVITNISENSVSEYCETTRNDKTYTYKIAYNTPYVIGAPYVYKTEKTTVQMINVVWAMTINYGTNAIITPPDDYLKISYFDGSITNDVKIKYIQRREKTIQPNYEPTQYTDNSFISYRKINTTWVYIYTLNKVEGDNLIDKLTNIINHNGSEVEQMTLKIDGNTAGITISSFSINEIWQNGVAIINLTLTI